MDNKKFVLREFFSLCDGGVCQDFLTESEKIDIKSNGAMYLTGVAQRADHQNGNGRVYPFHVLQREVENYTKLVKENRASGELDHPEDTIINLKNVSHRVINIWWEGKDVMVKLKVGTTPAGQTLRSLVNDGTAIGLSSRGLGSVKDMGGKLLVEDDFQLICFDVVAEPSTKGAFMSMMEGKNLNPLSKSDKINRTLNEVLKGL
jgi:hypothetical protein